MFFTWITKQEITGQKDKWNKKLYLVGLVSVLWYKLFSVKHLENMHIQQPKPSQGFKETNYDFLITSNLVHYYLCFYFLIENVI
jgi:hypothetical protein